MLRRLHANSLGYQVLGPMHTLQRYWFGVGWLNLDSDARDVLLIARQFGQFLGFEDEPPPVA